MQMLDGRLVHSASDLNAFTECVHLNALERGVAAGILTRPEQNDPTADLLARKGSEHELRYLERLRARFGERLVAFDVRPEPTRAGYAAAEAASIAAMAGGADVIYQPTFFDGTFLGRADFLRKVNRRCARWEWSYEVVDTKLALSPKPYFVVQLCNYSEHLERLTGSSPESASIVLGSGSEQHFRLADFAAYYRRLKNAYLESVATEADAYPVACGHCDVCRWAPVCSLKRDADDHLSLVAGIRRDQIRKLQSAGVGTLTALAGASDEHRPVKLRAQTFVTLRAQAAEQHRYRAALAARGAARHSYTFRADGDARSGFARLPEPSAGDIFFDMEGDPMYRPDRPLEYLFGVYVPDTDEYVPFWGTTPADERVAFESFVDFVLARQERYPDLHVYHYAPYETTALKRLMGRFGSRENAIDQFLARGTFVDLYPVVKQSVWISQPSYSIKKVEALYGFTRTTHTRGGDVSIVMFESWLETQDPATLDDIRAYNEDDCRSTFALREWLVERRAERNAGLPEPIPWREPPPDHAAPESDERSALESSLLEGIPVPDSVADVHRLPDATRARWLLGNLLNYHRREQKPEWWEHFHRLQHQSDLVEGDAKALGGLQYRADRPAYKLAKSDRNSVHAFRYPPQEHAMQPGDFALDGATGKSAGEVISVDDLTGTLEIKLAKSIDPPSRLEALLPAKPINQTKRREAVEGIARAYQSGTLAHDHPATLALLLGRLPRLAGRGPGSIIQPEVVARDTVSALIAAVDRSYLVVQGPPGSGKTTLGAHAVLDLLAAGKRVALAAHSHKALHNLVAKIEDTAWARGVSLRGCHKSAAQNPDSVYRSSLAAPLVTNTPTVDGYAGCALVSATTFAWAESSQRGAFDYVFVDEAGQVALADALIASMVASNVVLLGDPQQLSQVSKCTHPPGVDPSILAHLLGTNATVAVDRGVFLDRSYRLQPAIDAFVSDAFYDGRLLADPPNSANRIIVAGRTEAGPRYADVAHDDNQRRSSEEAEYLVGEITRLLDGGLVAIRDAPLRPLTPADVLIVAPYNAQRTLIGKCLRAAGLDSIRVGTVDKFQGQEAPIVFYSMTTSSAELAPRGLEFLFDGNRLNVAISRAQALSVIVCSPQLFAARATTVDTMRLLNLLCAYIETASAAMPLPPAASFARHAGAVRSG